MSKKYQVFISSTYTDLVEERKGVEETIIRAGDIPVGMEAFPAADEEQFEFIKSIIDQCDYYVLIVAGRYGSLSDDGHSYTEKEFRYAVEKKIPVLFMLREDIDKLPADKTEQDRDAREKLNKFIALASNGRLRKTWSTIDGLKLLVREALDHSKATKPRPGWVRGDLAASPELLKKIAELTLQKDELKKAAQSESPVILPEKFEVERDFNLDVLHFEMVHDEYGNEWASEKTSQILVASSKVFAFVAPSMRGPLIHRELSRKIAVFALGGKESRIVEVQNVKIEEGDFHDILLHWEALGLVKTFREKTSKGNNDDFSEITDAGNRKMLSDRIGLGN
ncbi:DUF4062 domain-containing protein [Sulfitobacter sp. PR48]|uniref:DUF4062 domain-containing protein n=1 Tax=Sulfitobacter sp. PR48 TaxID=3028383 RepID=UPI00237AA20B|nr:DUF4062 domain-containing protein [Sulfitobacter sp. PR48]MDD9723475.1 DUF4062 domain-containing protein [Sulfitobacter sp. PR48]